MKRNWQVMVGFDPAAPVDTTHGAPPAGGGAGVTPGASPAADSGAGAPPPASPPGSLPGSGAAPRMYTSEEVSNTVRERLAREQEKYAPYKELGDPKAVSERLARLEKLEQAIRGEQVDPHSPEERELRGLFTKLFPGVDKASDLDARIQAIERAEQERHFRDGRVQIEGLAKEKFGELTPEALSLVEGAITASIGQDKEALKAFFNGDRQKVVDEHFSRVFEKQIDPFLRSASSRYSSGKATDKAELPPPVRKGGVQAPSASEKPLTPEERREAAWAYMQGQEGR